MRRLTATVIFIAAALAAAASGRALALWVEARVEAAALSRLAVAGEGWASLQADGLRLTLSGAPITEAARDRALTLSAAPFAVVIDATAPVEAPATMLPDLALSMIVEPGRATLTGRSGGAAFAKAAQDWAAAKGLLWRDLSVIGAKDEADLSGLEDLLAIAAAPLHGRIDLSADGARIAGLVPDDAVAARIEAAAERLRALGWWVEVAIDAPAPRLGPFRLTANRADGLLRCAASDPGEAAEIAATAEAALGASGAPCVIGLGAPDENWAAAAQATLSALQGLDAAEVEMIERDVTFTARAPTEGGRAEAAARRLKAALPPSYRLTFRNAAAGAAAEAPAPPPLFSLRLDRPGPGDFVIAGPFGAEAGDALAAYARAALPGAEVRTENVGPAAAAAPAGWRPAALAAITALAALELGEATLRDEGIALSGLAPDAPALKSALAALAPAGVAGWPIETRIRLSPARVAARQALPAETCVANLSAIAAEIGFEPGRAELTAAAAEAIPRLAAIARRCAGGRVEIEGHTDSQGSEGTNLRLSRDRAEAVRAALIGAGVPRARLAAKGYGESRPIADNGTEAGREKNRRIAFRLMEDAE